MTLIILAHSSKFMECRNLGIKTLKYANVPQNF